MCSISRLASVAIALWLASSTCHPALAGKRDPLWPNRVRSFFYQHDRQRYYGATQYPPRDAYDHYPRYGYGAGMPTYHWGLFGAHHRPQRVMPSGAYSIEPSWTSAPIEMETMLRPVEETETP